MKFTDIANIWSIDVNLLSNADRGRVYYERAKQIVDEALNKPAMHPSAVEGNRFSRSYVVTKIGATASVTTQNPKIRALLLAADQQLKEDAIDLELANRPDHNRYLLEIKELQVINAGLQSRINELERENTELRQ